MSFLKINAMDFAYDGKNKILSNFNLELKKGEFHCILGPSGCGKSTILHLIAGFLKLSSGSITLDEQVLNRKDVFLNPEERDLGIVFQEHCLFPHLTVEGNINFGMNPRKDPQRLNSLLELVGLADKKKCYPKNLSGGEQQRVAIVRSMASDPKIMLMDEPFSALDLNLRVKLRRQVKELFNSLQLTTLMVTHSQEEAFEIGDRVTVLNESLEYQTGDYQELFFSPQSPFLVEFINSGILLTGRYQNSSRSVLTANGDFKIINSADFKDGEMAFLFIPFHHIQVSRGEMFLTRARLISLRPRGGNIIYSFAGENEGIRPSFFEMEGLLSKKNLKAGEEVNLYLKEKRPIRAMAINCAQGLG
ncbi:MAG: ABC transporter ATP-binding protein [Halobacteriovoraceae bacterium]|nr:ABC transporter ATP-binding protein [Halobacteriovoraceae bacterium]